MKFLYELFSQQVPLNYSSKHAKKTLENTSQNNVAENPKKDIKFFHFSAKRAPGRKERIFDKQNWRRFCLKSENIRI